MAPPKPSHNRGDVVLVLYPNSDLRTAKTRPALIVQADNLQTGLPKVVVAVITSRFFLRAILIMRFCRPGTAASPTSTLKSPRATMMASDASMISPRAGIASARSILAISKLLPPAACISSRASFMSSALRGNDTAR